MVSRAGIWQQEIKAAVVRFCRYQLVFDCRRRETSKNPVMWEWTVRWMIVSDLLYPPYKTCRSRLRWERFYVAAALSANKGSWISGRETILTSAFKVDESQSHSYFHFSAEFQMNIFMKELIKGYFFVYGTKDKTQDIKLFQLNSKLFSSGFFSSAKILLSFIPIKHV